MARRSSSGRSSRSAPRAAPPAKQVDRAPPPAPAQSGARSLLGTVADGIGFGAGIAVANRAVDAVLGPTTIKHETVATEAAAPAADACFAHSKAFQDCLNSYGNEISKCQFYMDMLAECKKNSATSLRA